MVFGSDKITKNCFYCKKDVKNLGLHIANQHPNVFEKIDDSPISATSTEKQTPINTLAITSSNNTYRGSNINEIVKEKLETMLNIKIIEMLSKGASLQDINSVINPPTSNQPTIQDIKNMHDILYKDSGNNPVNVNMPLEDSSGGILELLTASMPLIRDLLQKRNEGADNVQRGTNKEGSEYNSGAIPEEVTRNTIKPIGFSQESGIIIPTEQQDNRIPELNNQGFIWRRRGFFYARAYRFN